jgi:hypothetical protein
MSFHLLDARVPRRTLAVLLLTLAALFGACSKSSSDAPPGAVGSPSCPALGPDSGLAPYETLASGTAVGTGVGASFCNLLVYAQSTTGNGAPYSLGISSSSQGASSHVDAPASGTEGTVSVSIGIGSATPGVYSSSDGTQCGSINFSYGVPVATAAECAAADADGPCPTGCTFNNFCQSFPCSCIPVATTYVFQASGELDEAAVSYCGQTPSTPLGSWTVTLTSVDTDNLGDGQVVPHGTLVAKLPGTTGNSETVTLSLTF